MQKIKLKLIFEDVIIPLIDKESTNTQFYVYGGDITKGKSSNQKNRIYEAIKKFKKKEHINLQDIDELIIVTDTDGVFIDDSRLIASNRKEYCDDIIKCKDVNSIKSNNTYKSTNIIQLVSKSEFRMHKHCMKFSIYYFSCNLDHVLYNKRNLPDNQKSKKAILHSEKYVDNPSEFADFLNECEFYTGNDYMSTWNYVQKGVNSLKRCTNMYIYLNKFDAK